METCELLTFLILDSDTELRLLRAVDVFQEAIEQNPIMYELMLEMGWRKYLLLSKSSLSDVHT
jgi:hypothetical protein